MTLWPLSYCNKRKKNQDRTDGYFDHDDNVEYADKLIQVHYFINNVQMHVAI